MTSSLKFEITVYFFWLSLPVHSGSLKRIDTETAVLPTLFLLNVSTALKGTHNYIFIWYQNDKKDDNYIVSISLSRYI